MTFKRTGEYRAVFEIDGGVSQGFGVKYSDKYTREEIISSSGGGEAYKTAMIFARGLARDSLSNPETGKTVVRLISLTGNDGPVAFDASKSVVEVGELEHLFDSAED